MIANVLVGLVALLHATILVLEMFLWETPRGRKAFGLTAAFAAQTKVLAANQGLYNGFLAAGLFWALLLGGSQSVPGSARRSAAACARPGRLRRGVSALARASLRGSRRGSAAVARGWAAWARSIARQAVAATLWGRRMRLCSQIRRQQRRGSL